jgi:hypothetical protein
LGPRDKSPHIWLAIAGIIILVLVLGVLGVSNRPPVVTPAPTPTPAPVLHIDRLNEQARNASLARNARAGDQGNVQPSCEEFALSPSTNRVFANLTWAAAPQGAEKLTLTLFFDSCTGKEIGRAGGSSPISIPHDGAELSGKRIATSVTPYGDGVVLEQPYRITVSSWYRHMGPP